MKFGKAMSKIGKKTIKIPDKVSVKNEDGWFVVQGEKGVVKVKMLPGIEIAVENGEISVKPMSATKQVRSNWGTMRSLIMNATEGVTKGYEKWLDIEGVGFRAVMDGKNINLFLGYSHPIKVEAPEGITLSVEKNSIKVSGIDKNLVGQIAADIRDFKKPEPYKGKGIRYRGEVVRRKAGKKVAGTTA